MARLAKVQLIKQLRLVDLLCALRVSPDVDSEFLAVCAELASLVGVELLAAWQKAVEGKAQAEMPTLVPPLLTPLAGRAFVFMVHPDVTVRRCRRGHAARCSLLTPRVRMTRGTHRRWARRWCHSPRSWWAASKTSCEP